MIKRHKILFISNRPPYPQNQGDKIRANQFLEFFNGKHNLDILVLCENQYEYRNFLKMKLKFPHSQAVYTNPIISKVNFFRALFSPKIPSIVTYFYSRKFKRVIFETTRKKRYDFIFCHSLVTSQYLLDKKITTKVIFDICDIDSNRYNQYIPYVGRWRAFWLKREVKKMEDFQNLAFSRFYRIIVSTPKEKELVPEEYQQKTRVVSIYANLVSKRGSKRGSKRNAPLRVPRMRDAAICIFVGTMKYFPNIVGVIWFCKKVLPYIQKEIPKVKFYIVGRKPAQSIQKLTSKNVIITGEVERVSRYYQPASVAVVPLPIAQGVQTKVLESFSFGAAVVATKKVARGLAGVKDGRELLIADTPLQFAQKTLELLRNAEKRKKLSKNARAFLKKGYTKEIVENQIKKSFL
ncbi:MAG: glycosyl transferase (group I) [Candidatus Berkelbacteria bacterium Licking1014_7]|uniref:Glycosyl transferase (Group I) n=1 Tax=Candidatus Berkelbacteria bacterium Licking1014_7 TaxID=2017147 RepID=A0A554LJP5_9BACT|nr:MAG: glycosyl transferase (group I) [Candidatus Berkelbacteria bacterium Licking1014_7]